MKLKVFFTTAITCKKFILLVSVFAAIFFAGLRIETNCNYNSNKSFFEDLYLCGNFLEQDFYYSINAAKYLGILSQSLFFFAFITHDVAFWFIYKTAEGLSFLFALYLLIPGPHLNSSVRIVIRAPTEFSLYYETYRIAADTKFFQLLACASYVRKIEEVVGEFAVVGASAIYVQNVRDHSRVMQESDGRSKVKAFMLGALRILRPIFQS